MNKEISGLCFALLILVVFLAVLIPQEFWKVFDGELSPKETIPFLRGIIVGTIFNAMFVIYIKLKGGYDDSTEQN